MGSRSKYDKYKLSEYELFVLKQSTGGRKAHICPTCGSLVSAKFLRKMRVDGIIHAECLLCFSKKHKEEH